VTAIEFDVPEVPSLTPFASALLALALVGTAALVSRRALL
jgi:MYXO-CTERM domain-containing protein